MDTQIPVPPTTLVIIGISGDLAGRKLIPALQKIKTAGILPTDFKIIGVTRRDLNVANFFSDNDPLKNNFSLFKMDLSSSADYIALKEKINAQPGAQTIFYLSIPPHAVLPLSLIHI